MDCSYYQSGRCRSCTELPQAYHIQLAAKDQHCRSVLSPHRNVEWLLPVPSRESAFRNKAKMVVSGTCENPLLGILDTSGVGVDLSSCPLYPDKLQQCFPVLKAFITQAGLEPYDIQTRHGELKYVLLTLDEHSGDTMLRFVARSQNVTARLRKHLAHLIASLPGLKVVSLNIQPEHKAILEGEKEILLSAQPDLTIRVNHLPLHLRPQSFFQTNIAVAAQLYRQAQLWVDELSPRSIWDLYCGVGGFALHCANEERDVIGIENSTQAIMGAEQSRRELQLSRIQFRAMKAADFTLDVGAIPPELVIVNPPRRGIGPELCEFLNHSETRWIIYSSCNVSSLATDLTKMPNFYLRRARVLDMFPHTKHYEVIVLLTRSG